MTDALFHPGRGFPDFTHVALLNIVDDQPRLLKNLTVLLAAHGHVQRGGITERREIAAYAVRMRSNDGDFFNMIGKRQRVSLVFQQRHCLLGKGQVKLVRFRGVQYAAEHIPVGIGLLKQSKLELRGQHALNGLIDNGHLQLPALDGFPEPIGIALGAGIFHVQSGGKRLDARFLKRGRDMEGVHNAVDGDIIRYHKAGKSKPFAQKCG